ncbi:MAG TPA: translation initiation factor IF-2 N-terminal domain-containing protein, partial [Kofleriaceae bacterium]
MTEQKMRVYEIAKEVGIPNKDLIAKIRALGLEVNNHMSSLDADDVARIKRSLEKEKGAGAAPVQQTKLSTGTVLRRRSSGDKEGEGTERSAERAPVVAPAPAPVIRRRAAEEAAPTASPSAAGSSGTSTPPPSAPAAVRARPSEPSVERAPVVVAPPPAAVREPEAPPTRRSEPAIERPAERSAERPPVAPPVERPAPVVVAPTPPPPAPVRAPEPPTRRSEPSISANQSISSQVERPAPVAPAPRASSPVINTQQPRPQQSVSHGSHSNGPIIETKRSRVVIAAPGVSPQHAGTIQARDAGPQGVRTAVPVSRDLGPEPPPSTPLPPRVVNPRSAQPSTPPPIAAQQQARPEESSGDARSRFEAELQKARVRTSDRPRPETGQIEPQAPEPVVEVAPTPPRDPSRPAVGSVIALPPRIKITERTPVVGRPPPGAPPANPIRGRFAQSQQRGGRPGGPGGRPGMGNDFGRKKLPLGKKGKQTQLTTPAEHKRVIRIEDSITVSELARNMGVKAPEVLKKLWG